MHSHLLPLLINIIKIYIIAHYVETKTNTESVHKQIIVPGRPFLAKLSTDTWDTLLCARNVVLQTPHRFETAAPRASMAEFRRASIEFGKLARVRT